MRKKYGKIEGNVLVYTQRRLRKFFHAIAERTFEGEITYCSDWPDLEEIYFMPIFYEHYKANSLTQDLSKGDLEQINARCRVLRLLPKKQAERMIHAMYRTLNDLVQKYLPCYFLGLSVDNYVLDIFSRVCGKYNVIQIQLMDGSIDNTILVFSYGEYNKVRDPSEEEVDYALSRLMDDSSHFTYDNNRYPYTFFKHFKVFSIWWTKLFIFRFMSLKNRDPLNFRFLYAYLRCEMGQSAITNYKAMKHFDEDWEQRIHNTYKPLLYIPLGFTPEASTDYWLKDLRYVNYENFMLDLCSQLRDYYLLVVKDHWAMLGMRWSSFYENLKSIPNLVLVPSHTNGRALLNIVDRVLVGSGTAGVEAAVRGKRVVTLCYPYYYVKGHYLPFDSASSLSNLPDLLEKFSPLPARRENQSKIVRRMLEPTLVGSLRVNSMLDSEANWERTSESLKDYISRLRTVK